jgi:hypothetical protein
MRTVPGVPACIEDQNWGMYRGMKPSDLLGSDDALAAFKAALDEAATPNARAGADARPMISGEPIS